VLAQGIEEVEGFIVGTKRSAVYSILPSARQCSVSAGLVAGMADVMVELAYCSAVISDLGRIQSAEAALRVSSLPSATSTIGSAMWWSRS